MCLRLVSQIVGGGWKREERQNERKNNGPILERFNDSGSNMFIHVHFGNQRER